MKPSKLFAISAVVLTALVVPSHADEGAGVLTDFAGSVTRTSALDGVSGLTGYSLTGTCSFGGVLTPTNRLNITYGGAAKASGPQVPQLTYVRCSIGNFAGTHSAYSEFATGGPASATTGSATGWPLSSFTVCVEGFGVFGPTPVVIVNLPKTCLPPGGESGSENSHAACTWIYSSHLDMWIWVCYP